MATVDSGSRFFSSLVAIVVHAENVGAEGAQAYKKGGVGHP